MGGTPGWWRSVTAIEEDSAPARGRALRRRLADGALRTAGERSWDEVYDQLLKDYGDAMRAARVSRAA
jgi:hypothetical protein